MKQYDPLLLALSAGVGGVLGAILTLIAQVIIGAINWRRERIVKTFDTRLEIYVEFCTLFKEVNVSYEKIADLITSGESLRQKIKRITDRSNYELKSDAIEVKRMGDALSECQVEADKIRDKLDSMKQGLPQLTTRLAGVGAAMDLVSSSQVRLEVQKVFREVRSGKNPTYKTDFLGPFLRAARQELKIVD